MAGEDDDSVIVELPGETGDVIVEQTDGDQPVKKTAVPADDDLVSDLKNQFTAIKRQNDELATQNQHVVRQLTETQTRLHRVEGEVVTSQLDTVLSGIAAADAEASAAEQALAIAIEAGDAAAQARANRAIAAAEGRKARLEEAKDELEEQAKARPTQPQPQRQQASQPPRRASADPIEAFVERMSPRSAAWIRRNPDCVTDPKLNARMLAAHNLALADDVEVDSDEYFRRIEDGIRPQQQKQQAQSQGDGRRPSSAAASPAGAGGGLNGGTTVKLTKGEAASATDGTLVWNYDDPSPNKRFKKGDPIGLTEMARRKHEGQKRGLYDKSQYEAS